MRFHSEKDDALQITLDLLTDPEQAFKNIRVNLKNGHQKKNGLRVDTC